MRIAFASVAFNDRTLLNFVEYALRLFDGEDVLYCVADNSTDANVANELYATLSRDPRCRYVKNAANIGYFPGLNECLNLAGKVDVVVATNYDVSFAENFCSLIRGRYEELVGRNIGVVAPNIYDEGLRRPLNPLKEHKGLSYWQKLKSRIFSTNYALYSAKNKWSQFKASLNRVGKPEVVEGERLIYCPHGAVFVLLEPWLEKVGRLPEEVFLWYEEFTLANQCLLNGLGVLYVPTLNVTHRRHGPTTDLRSRERFELRRESYVGSSRVDLQACKLEYSIVSPK